MLYYVLQYKLQHNTTKAIIMALTTNDIHAAAESLHDQGITPTQNNVREALGGGSYSTIGAALKTWKTELHEHEQLKKTDMPDSLRDEITVLGVKIWQEADSIANKNLTAEREALAVTAAKAQAELDDAAEAIVTLEAEQAASLELLRLSTDKADKATSEAEASAIEITSLNTFLTDLQHKLDIEQERTATATASLTATNDKLDSTRLQLDTANDQLTQARESIATYKATNSAQVADIERLQADVIDHKQAHQVTADKLTERTAERDQLAKDLAAVSGKLDAVTEQSKQLLIERDSAVSDNKALAATNAKLDSTNERLSADIAGLNDDKKALIEQLNKLKSSHSTTKNKD